MYKKEINYALVGSLLTVFAIAIATPFAFRLANQQQEKEAAKEHHTYLMATQKDALMTDMNGVSGHDCTITLKSTDMSARPSYIGKITVLSLNVHPAKTENHSEITHLGECMMNAYHHAQNLSDFDYSDIGFELAGNKGVRGHGRCSKASDAHVFCQASTYNTVYAIK